MNNFHPKRIELIQKIREFLNRKFYSWIIVGTFSVSINVITFMILYSSNFLSKSIPTINLIAYVISSSVNYIGHQIITFQNKSLITRSFSRYLIYSSIVWFVSSFIITLIIYCGANAFFAKLISLLFLLPLGNFIFRNWVYLDNR